MAFSLCPAVTFGAELNTVFVHFEYQNRTVINDGEQEENDIAKALAATCAQRIGCWKFEATRDKFPQLKVEVFRGNVDFRLRAKFSPSADVPEVEWEGAFGLPGDDGLNRPNSEKRKENAAEQFTALLKQDESAIRQAMMKVLWVARSPVADAADLSKFPMLAVLPVGVDPYAKRHLGASTFRVGSRLKNKDRVSLYFKGILMEGESDDGTGLVVKLSQLVNADSKSPPDDLSPEAVKKTLDLGDGGLVKLEEAYLDKYERDDLGKYEPDQSSPGQVGLSPSSIP